MGCNGDVEVGAFRIGYELFGMALVQSHLLF